MKLQLQPMTMFTCISITRKPIELCHHVSNFRKGRHAPIFQKVRKTSEKEKWRNAFSVASLKARGREIAGKYKTFQE